MLIGIPKEKLSNECRVAATPTTVNQLIKLGFKVIIEHNAGIKSNFSDDSYITVGAIISNDIEVWQSDIILKVNIPDNNEIELLCSDSILISFIYPEQNYILLKKLAERNITVMAMDCVPRISRAQNLDALSSMANIVGYRAIIEAASEFNRFFAGQITAAGKILPAKVMVIGAGVAGLSAIGTASNLGAIVYAFDTRPEVKEQIHSMGATFIEMNIKKETGIDAYKKLTPENLIKAEIELLSTQVEQVDIIITTAVMPRNIAPKLITTTMVNNMKPGSVIIDLAAQAGGNCELTVAEQMVVTSNGVKIIGYTDFPSRLSTQASQLYSTNLVNLIKLLCQEKDSEIKINFDDEIIRSITVAHNMQINWPILPIYDSALEKKCSSSKLEESLFKESKIQEKTKLKSWPKYSILVLFIFLFIFLAKNASPELLSHITIFTLSCLVGYYVVWNVSHALHTPLMSVTNAISGIIIVGAILQIDHGGWISILAFFAILISSINIFGGFNITHRMLKMFFKN